MSKRALKSYLDELTKKQLQEQVLDLYTRFKPVKTYYNFVFNPNEEKLLDAARFNISKEYFPVNTRKPKTRRSVAHKVIKHYIQLGVDPFVIGDVMLFNIEIAQQYTAEKRVKLDSFYTSMLKSFIEAINYTEEHGIQADFNVRIGKIIKTVEDQKWMNAKGFSTAFQNKP
jgi:hypothetical protein